MNDSILKQKVKKFPQNPGVYFFRGAKKEILYIGKATNLRSRVQSYFHGAETREHIGSMMPSVFDFNFQQTDSVLEALILESNLIKKHQPKYNIKEKDGKSFSYFVITKEDFPRVLILRKTDLESKKSDLLRTEVRPRVKFGYISVANSYGPYTSKQQMQVALKIIRKIFPFHANVQKTEKGCLDFQIGLCPGPYAGAISKKDYKKNIRGVRMILEGKKKRLVTTLEKEMKEAAKKNEFEKAAQLRNKLFALKHIRDIALISKDFEDVSHNVERGTWNNKNSVTRYALRDLRVEAYDISNISGANATGSMVVFADGQPDKSQYRKFKIKTVEGSDDVGMMKEILLRRFKNNWPMPDLVMLDGGIGHLNMAEKLLRKELGLAINIVAVAKGADRKKLDLRFKPNDLKMEIKEVLNDKNLVKQIMDEAHRFAITYHRKLRRKSFI